MFVQEEMCVCVYAYICMHVYVCVYVCMYVWMDGYMQGQFMFVQEEMCLCVHTHTHIHTHTQPFDALAHPFDGAMIKDIARTYALDTVHNIDAVRAFLHTPPYVLTPGTQGLFISYQIEHTCCIYTYVSACILL
jgi:hypothetical protein